VPNYLSPLIYNLWYRFRQKSRLLFDFFPTGCIHSDRNEIAVVLFGDSGELGSGSVCTALVNYPSLLTRFARSLRKGTPRYRISWMIRCSPEAVWGRRDTAPAPVTRRVRVGEWNIRIGI